MTAGRVAASREQALALDAAAARHGVSAPMLMALAGFQCAALARRLLLDTASPHGQVSVLVGKGNNGGDALGCARHLSAWGFTVRCLLVGDGEQIAAGDLARAAAGSGAELRRAGAGELDQATALTLEHPDLIVDGLLGTGARGAPRAEVAALIQRLNRSSATVMAIDLPSGLDAETGRVEGDCVRADHTLMLGAAKLGCQSLSARHWVGRLWLADIGIPAAAYRDCGLVPADHLGPEPIPLGSWP
ncbi:MAG: NAD(P)H-hydrate epimerase [Candidatus Dormibacteria bacterium]